MLRFQLFLIAIQLLNPVSNGMPVDFARENLIIEIQNRLNDAILDV